MNVIDCMNENRYGQKCGTMNIRQRLVPEGNKNEMRKKVLNTRRRDNNPSGTQWNTGIES